MPVVHDKYDLKSLLDAKHPFLEKMRDKAPGTYKHCQNVANLCESIALELELDAGIVHEKIGVVTCIKINDEVVIYKHDVLLGLTLTIEKREMRPLEFD